MEQSTYSYYITPQQREAQELKKSSTFVALMLLAMMAIQVVLTVAVRLGLLTGLVRLAETHAGYMLFNMIIYILCLALPAVAVALISGRRQNPFPSAPVSGGMMGAGVLGGMAVAVVANLAASGLMSWLSLFGIPEPKMPDNLQPTLISLALNILSTATLPALIEEMIFRGYILGALRAHGDGLAVVLSATLFGLFHGNVLQIPFAFILGLAMGYLVVLTDSIWPAVLLHFVNNLMSVLLSFFGKCYPDQRIVISNVTLLAVAAMGAVVLTVLRRPGYLKPIGNGISLFRVLERTRKLLFSPAMVLAFVAMLATLFYSIGSGQT